MVDPATVIKACKTAYEVSREAATLIDENEEKAKKIGNYLSKEESGKYQEWVEKSREQAKEGSLSTKMARKIIISQIDSVESYEDVVDATHDFVKDEEKVTELTWQAIDTLSRAEEQSEEDLEEINSERKTAEQQNDPELLKKAISNEVKEIEETNKEVEAILEVITVLDELTSQTLELVEEENQEFEDKKIEHSTIQQTEELAEKYDLDINEEDLRKLENEESVEEDQIKAQISEVEDLIQSEEEEISKLSQEFERLIQDLENNISELGRMHQDLQYMNHEFPGLDQKVKKSEELAEENLEKLKSSQSTLKKLEEKAGEAEKIAP